MKEGRDETELPPITGPDWGPGPGRGNGLPEIEGYQIIGPLGEGGMGTVWKAVQLSTRREVALKVLGKGAFASEKARARFEREVELTARLQHPNIARIYDSGVHQGVYYYAMELIDGVPLDEYVQEEKLTQREIVELVRIVCKAVEHAHQSGVIHRGLKPSNVLVTDDGQPHVLDFGLAKSFGEERSLFSLSTQDSVPGTPAYMSPEQAAGRVKLIDTRTDVYSLGVMLFRLLTKEFPHSVTGTRYEVLRRIAEEEIRRPRAITKEVDRELEALLLKALARDPAGRYPYAGTLAQDVENYLTGEPLIARPATTTYFLRKRLWKYRVPVAVASSVLAIIVGTGVFAYLRVSAERSRAIAARDELEDEVLKGRAVHAYLRDIHTWRRLDRGEQLDYGATQVAAKFAGKPEVEAAVRTALGHIYLFVDEHKAEVQFRQALQILEKRRGPYHSETIDTMGLLAAALHYGGEYDKVEGIQRELYSRRKVAYGEAHPDTLLAMDVLAFFHRRAGRFDEWEKMNRRILEIREKEYGEENRDTLFSMEFLGPYILIARNKLCEAEGVTKRYVNILRRVRGEKHEDTLWAMSRLAAILEQEGKLDEAEAWRRRILANKRNRFGEGHRETLAAMNALAVLFQRREKLDEAAEMNARIFEIRGDRDGEDHPDTCWAKRNLDQSTESKPIGLGKGEIVVDDGFDGVLCIDWKIVNPDPSHYSLAKRPGNLTITTQRGTLSGSNRNYENLFLVDLPGDGWSDFDLTTCMLAFSPRANYNQAGLICYTDDDNYLKFVYEHNHRFGGPVFTVGAATQARATHVHFPTYLELEKVWLRIVKRGDCYTFSTSLDGEDLLPLRYPSGDSTGLFQGCLLWGDGSVGKLGLLANNGGVLTAPEVDASFDFFEVRAIPTQTDRADEFAPVPQKKSNVETS